MSATENMMPKSLLVIVTSDPRTSHRPAEAVRIAAGVAAWKKVQVTLYLAGLAILALGADTDDLINEESFTQFLPILAETERPVLVEAGASMLEKLGETSVPFQPVSPQELAKLTRNSTYLLRF